MLFGWWESFWRWKWRPKLRIVVKLGHPRQQTRAPGRPRWHTQYGPKSRFLMAKVQITDNENLPLSVDESAATQDKKGNPAAPIDAGSEQWSVDNPSLLTLDTTTGPNVVVSAVGPLGTANVTVKATAGGLTCAGTIEVDVGSDAPVSINISAGTPTKQS